MDNRYRIADFMSLMGDSPFKVLFDGGPRVGHVVAFNNISAETAEWWVLRLVVVGIMAHRGMIGFVVEGPEVDDGGKDK